MLLNRCLSTCMYVPACTGMLSLWGLEQVSRQQVRAEDIKFVAGVLNCV